MKHVTDRIQAYLDGELSPEEIRAVGDHVHQCPACRQALEDRQELWRRIEAPALQVEVSIWPRLAERLERRRAQRWSWPQRSLALAAMTAGILLGWQLGRPLQEQRTNGDLAAEMSYLRDSHPSLDQLWLQVGANGGPGS